MGRYYVRNGQILHRGREGKGYENRNETLFAHFLVWAR